MSRTIRLMVRHWGAQIRKKDMVRKTETQTPWKRATRIAATARKEGKVTATLPAKNTKARIVVLAMKRKGGATPAQLQKLTGYKACGWKVDMEYYAARYGYRPMVLPNTNKGPGRNRYHLAPLSK